MKDQPPRTAIIQELRNGQLYAEWQPSSSSSDVPTPSSLSAHSRVTGLKQLLQSAFMPEGPVTPDYYGFVAWNTVQATSSYLRGVLSSHAVFKGVGVGSEAATALGAVFQFFVRDILGMAGGILFVYAFAGTSFDSNAKQWRLFADCMNNVAMALDLASPLVPGCFMLLSSLGAVARALVGISGGATGAALTQHFAAAGGSNAADISAKADSRERATSIVGTLLGMALTQHLHDNVLAAWAVFLVLTWLHVWANIRALRCLVLSSLNQPRLKLLLQHYMQAPEKVYSPQQMAGLESLMVPPLAALADWCRGPTCGVTFGARLSSALDAAAAAVQPGSSGQCVSRGQQLQHVLAQQPAASSRQYMLCVTGSRRKRVQVVLAHGLSQEELLRAYLHATHLALSLSQGGAVVDKAVAGSQRWSEQSLPTFFLRLLSRQGWQLDRLYLPRAEWTATW